MSRNWSGMEAMRTNSLALRLFLSATAVTVVILLITGVVLSSLYREGVERSFDRRLDVYLKTLVAEVSAPEDTEKVPQALSEPLFDLPLSGWYWQTIKLSGTKPEVKASRSLWDGGLPHLEDLHVPTGPDGTRQRYVAGPEDQRLRLGARGDDPLAAKVVEQAAVMRDQVQHHLERARIAARATVIGTVTEVAPVVTALARSMEKIHRDRAIAIDIETAPATKFRGEKQDLEEMVGNLVDNACKWAQSRVAIEVMMGRAETAASQTLRVVVDDDGPGLNPSQRERIQVPRRGKRLDETKPGSGLGLSIVTDLAAIYGGALTLGTAPIGGLRAELVLPAA